MRILNKLEIDIISGGIITSDILTICGISLLRSATLTGGFLLGGISGGILATISVGSQMGPYGALVGMAAGLYASYRVDCLIMGSLSLYLSQDLQFIISCD